MMLTPSIIINPATKSDEWSSKRNSGTNQIRGICNRGKVGRIRFFSLVGLRCVTMDFVVLFSFGSAFAVLTIGSIFGHEKWNMEVIVSLFG